MDIIKRIIVFIIIFISSCTHPKYFTFNEGKTCLVLSVGGLRGLAHIGAIDALRENNIKIDYIYGNSMGSVIGGLYSYLPNRKLKSNVKSVIRTYMLETEKEIKSKAKTGFLFGAALAFLSGGLFGWETIIGSTLLNTFSVDKFDNRRFKSVLDKKFRYANIEDLKIPFATSYHIKSALGFKLQTISSGNLATAISRSSNNPFIFKNTSLNYIDPGLDRFSVVPIEDAIKHFKPNNIIAINVTGKPSAYNKHKNVKIIEINVDVNDVQINSIEKIDDTILDYYYEAGYDAVNQKLSPNSK